MLPYQQVTPNCNVIICTGLERLPSFQPAYQSSLAASGSPERAVDGNHDPLYHSGGSCSHTENSDSNPWWYLDMGDTWRVSIVTLTNRANTDNDSKHHYKENIINFLDQTE